MRLVPTCTLSAPRRDALEEMYAVDRDLFSHVVGAAEPAHEVRPVGFRTEQVYLVLDEATLTGGS